MFYSDGKLQYHVRVDEPNPLFARYLQQAIGGVEGEIRVAMQYLFQAWGARGPKKYRDLLLTTGTEELAHIEMLATAVALNLEGASPAVQEQVTADDPMTRAILGGMTAKNFLSSGLSAMPVDSDGVPFDMSHVYASGNVAADMYANVAAESTGRALATRLYELTDDPGMRDMLSFLIARDTMHQQQWLAAIEELGGPNALPIPDSFPQDQEKGEFSYAFLTTSAPGGPPPPEGRWSSGPSIDGQSEFTTRPAEPVGGEPRLGPPAPQGHAQAAQMLSADGAKGIVDTVKDAISGS